VEEIGKYAFWFAEKLDTLTIGKNVCIINENAFTHQNCIENVCFKDNNKLTSLINTFRFSESIKHVEFGKNMAIKRMRGTFFNSTIETVSVPSSVRYLNGAFNYAKNLKAITIENGIEVLGDNAFAFSGIKSIKMPKSLKSIKYGAFQGCTDLTQINLTNVRTLERLVFKDCTSLTSIDLTGVRYDNSENKNTFKGCTNLTKLYFAKEDGIEQFIGEDDVADNETVETVVIGGSINEIKSRAFANCKNLSVAMIGEGVTTIDDTAFDGCDKLTILCTEESYAAKYAAKNSIRYTTLTIDSIPDQQYTGKAVTPAVTVRFGGDKLTSGSDYSTQYSDNVKIGSAKVTVVGLGDYSIYGALARFNIVHTVHKYIKKVVKPTYAAKGYTLHTCSLCGKSYKSDYTAKLTVPKTTISKLTKKKKAFTVKWKKVSVATGYQIQYSTNKSFKSKKTVTVKGAKNVTKTVKKLKGKKKYYVRTRAYKTYKGKNYYSSWCKVKAVTTKK
ncbi:MAG: leucine-rich repeat domain-containing protein, partial [Ruminococcaceae bacterium]|nr:leucine-rich repeat domain-containing protein [Oscillospiraceae bacterium]